MNFSLAFIFSLASAILYSIISIFLGRVANKNGSYWTSFWIQIIGLPITLLFLPYFGLELSFDANLLPLIIFSIGIFVNFILYTKCLSIGPVPVVQSILRLSNIIVFILAILLLNESINIFKVTGATLIIIGVILVSLNIKELMSKKITVLTKALPLSLIHVAIGGAIGILLAISIKHYDAFSANVGIRIIVVTLFLASAFARPTPPANFFKTSWKILLLIAAGDSLAFILITLAIQLYEISLSTMMQSTFPVITAIIVSLFFHERLTKPQIVGIIITVLGGICMAASG